jgi:cytochrome c5
MFAVTRLSKYRENFNPDRAMNRKLLSTIAEEKAKKEKEVAAKAQKAAELAASGAQVVKLDSPELKRGYQIYHEEGACYTCHGDKAEGNDEP